MLSTWSLLLQHTQPLLEATKTTVEWRPFSGTAKEQIGTAKEQILFALI